MLKGRLGLESSKVPHADRAGCLYLARGALVARNGTLGFTQGTPTAADALSAGEYDIPFQGVSIILLGPGSTVSHDARRLLAHARTALAAVGEDGVRMYTAPPIIADRSGLARLQARIWADDDLRIMTARRMYALRLGEVLPHQALNHAASAVEAAAAIAVCATSTIPQLGFIHEDPGQSFVLDIADLYRDTITIACAFKAAKQVIDTPTENIERVTRRLTGRELAKRKIVPDMIERIKALIEGRD
ncbi:CRISPR-associated protein Cas1 [Roseovarius sp. 22II1-1F6A]|nr:CRISPR-associated protein Cas1 [Roseovarius sp. 22II1-1F6A]